MFNREIEDGYPEVLVDARIHGHAYPAVDMRFDIQPSFYRPSPKFKVFRPADVQKLMDVASTASPQSWLEVRSFRGETTRLRPDTTMSFADVFPILIN